MSWDSVLFQRHLTTRRFGRQIRFFTEVDSTNRWLSENWNDFTLNGAIVIAEHQTSGRGRFKRQWDDVPDKSMLFSVLLLSAGEQNNTGFHQMLPAISLARVLNHHFGSEQNISLKWPNDVLLNDRKLAGILAERFTINDKTITIVGMGINVNPSLQELSEPAREFGTSLFAETGIVTQRESMLAEIMNEWEPLYDSLREGDTGLIRDAWREFGPSLNTPITRIERGIKMSGAFAGLGEGGELLLRDSEGKVHEFYSGDIVY
jgi:BirA family biotin operon repressor/biotin-[acetyl-CoA-carboxylase] ligase